MKEVVAIHEAGHVCVVLKSPIRDCLMHVRTFQVGGIWRGECQLDGTRLRAIDRKGVFSFAKDIAGPLAQFQISPESIPPEINTAMEEQDGLLRAFWWLLNNKPTAQWHWGSDMEYWRTTLKFYRGFSYQSFYETESRVSTWIEHPAVRICIRQIADLLICHASLDRDALLKIDVSRTPELRLPDRLL